MFSAVHRPPASPAGNLPAPTASPVRPGHVADMVINYENMAKPSVSPNASAATPLPRIPLTSLPANSILTPPQNKSTRSFISPNAPAYNNTPDHTVAHASPNGSQLPTAPRSSSSHHGVGLPVVGSTHQAKPAASPTTGQKQRATQKTLKINPRTPQKLPELRQHGSASAEASNQTANYATPSRALADEKETKTAVDRRHTAATSRAGAKDILQKRLATARHHVKQQRLERDDPDSKLNRLNPDHPYVKLNAAIRGNRTLNHRPLPTIPSIATPPYSTARKSLIVNAYTLTLSD